MRSQPLLLVLPPAIQAMLTKYGGLHMPNATLGCQTCRSQGVRAHPSNAQASASFVFAADVGRQA